MKFLFIMILVASCSQATKTRGKIISIGGCDAGGRCSIIINNDVELLKCLAYFPTEGEIINCKIYKSGRFKCFCEGE